MNYLLLLAILLGVMASGTATFASDTPKGQCQIEDWRSVHVPAMKVLTIQAVTTCETGEVFIRLYETVGDKQQFLGVTSAIIQGYTLEAIAHSIPDKPKQLSIKYRIVPLDIDY